MKNITKPISIILSVLMLMSVFAVAPFTVSAATCGTTGDCLWMLDDAGALTISGNGAMEDYSDNHPAPWGKGITTVVIDDGVTRIGDYAFYGCSSLTFVAISRTVESIGQDVFTGCNIIASMVI